MNFYLTLNRAKNCLLKTKTPRFYEKIMLNNAKSMLENTVRLCYYLMGCVFGAVFPKTSIISGVKL